MNSIKTRQETSLLDQQNAQISPSPWEMWTPSNTNAWANPTHHPRWQLDSLTHFYTTMQQSLQWLQWYDPHLLPKLPLYMVRTLPHLHGSPWTQPTHHPKWHPDPISHFSTIQYTQKDRPTDKIGDISCTNTHLCSIDYSDAANNNNNDSNNYKIPFKRTKCTECK